MGPGNSITSTISYVKTFALLMFIYMFSGGFISIYLAAKIQSIPLAILGFLIFIIIPLFSIKNLQTHFVRKVVFHFEQEAFVLQIFKPKTEILAKEFKYEYKDIKSCVLSTTSSRTSTIKLFFFQGRKLQTTFFSEKKNADTNQGLIVFKRLYSFNQNILLLPPFYASKGGIVALVILTSLFIADIAVNILFKPAILPFSLFIGAALYIQVLVRRKREFQLFQQSKASILGCRSREGGN
jgi:hypothetical protein